MSTTGATIDPERRAIGKVEMLGEERWEEVHPSGGGGGIGPSDCSRAGVNGHSNFPHLRSSKIPPPLVYKAMR